VTGLISLFVRLLSLVGKELVEAIRRPGAILSLILGPFLIMAVFGFGYSGERRPLETMVVIPPESELPTDQAEYQELAGGGMHIVAVVADRAQADAGLAAGTLDVAIIAPENPEAEFRAGRQSVFEVVINVVDPVAANYAGFLANNLQSEVNREILRQAAEQGEGAVADAGLIETGTTPLAVVAEPTRAELRNVAPVVPGVVAFYAPAVLALIIQHLAVTLVALSMVKERTSGIMEMYRVAPVNAWEIVASKVFAYLFIGGVIAIITLGLMRMGFNVPMLGDPVLLFLMIVLVLVASLGLGLAIAVISDSERQAVQLSLLVLLASVFFSGFVLSIDEFNMAVRSVAHVLPVTHGIRLIQDIMLRGSITHLWQVGMLGLIAGLMLLFSWIGLRRGMTKLV
jgi:ABC-2 type transport system permease protein